MKILFNCLNMNKGGAERVISILANSMVKENDVTILTLRNKEYHYFLNNDIKKENVTVAYGNYLSNIISKISIMNLIKYKKKIVEINPDIIVSFLPEPSLKLMFIKRFSKKIKNIPVIISIRNDPRVEYKNKFIKLLMKKLYQIQLMISFFVKLILRKKIRNLFQ